MHLRDTPDPDDIERLREDELKREAAADLLAHIQARAQAEEARTRQLLDLLTAGDEPEQQDNPDALEEAA